MALLGVQGYKTPLTSGGILFRSFSAAMSILGCSFLVSKVVDKLFSVLGVQEELVLGLRCSLSAVYIAEMLGFCGTVVDFCWRASSAQWACILSLLCTEYTFHISFHSMYLLVNQSSVSQLGDLKMIPIHIATCNATQTK